MEKRLVISTDASANWTLPEETDVGGLQNVLHEAMRSGAVIRVPVVIQQKGRVPMVVSDLILNGKMLVSAVVMEF